MTLNIGVAEVLLAAILGVLIYALLNGFGLVSLVAGSLWGS